MSNTTTPINTLTRENLIVLIKNNVMNNSVEFSDTDVMETDSPVRKPTSLQPVIKKLFHSPISPQSPEKQRQHKQRSRKRKRNVLIPDNDEKLKTAYIKEREEYSPDPYRGMRKRVLISLFHSKEYCMEIGD